MKNLNKNQEEFLLEQAREREYEIVELEVKKALQKHFCRKKEVPYFAPQDGICWSCNKQIYNKLSKKECQTKHITGCPICAKSYCD